MLKAVLFDIDGTLVDSLGLHLLAYKAALSDYGFTFKDSEVTRLCFNRTEEDICDELGIPKEAQKFEHRYSYWVKKLLCDTKLFSDSITILKFLKRRKIKIGLITMSFNWYLQKISSKFGFGKYTSVMISADDVKDTKPAPEAVYKACRLLKVREAEALVVGDAKGDILMGKSAKAKTALYTPSENQNYYNFEEVIEETNPDFVIRNLREVENLIDSRGQK